MTTITHHDVLVSRGLETLAELFIDLTEENRFDLANKVYQAMYANALRNHSTGEYYYEGDDLVDSHSRYIADLYIEMATERRWPSY